MTTPTRPLALHGHTLALAPRDDARPMLNALIHQAASPDAVVVRAVPGDDRSGIGLSALLESRRTARPRPDTFTPDQVWIYAVHLSDMAADPAVTCTVARILHYGADHGIYALVGASSLPPAEAVNLDLFTCRVALGQNSDVLAELFGPSTPTPDTWGTVQAQHTPGGPVTEVTDIVATIAGPMFHPHHEHNQEPR